MNHLMLDLETWGLNRGNAIRSIGAVAFDPLTGRVDADHGFYQNVGFASQERLGLTKMASTEMWWDEPAQDSARALLEHDQATLYAALSYFKRWLGEKFANLEDNAEIRLWSRGTMDPEVFEGVFKAAGMDWPFSHRAPRDTRVVMDLAEGLYRFQAEFPQFEGIPHYALDDAINECRAMVHAYSCIGLSGTVEYSGYLETVEEETHVTRMEKELSELEDRAVKLYKFVLENPIFGTLEVLDQDLMNNQLAAMGIYRDTLKIRLDRAKGENQQ